MSALISDVSGVERLSSPVLESRTYAAGSVLRARWTDEPVDGSLTASISRPGDDRFLVQIRLPAHSPGTDYSDVWEIPPQAATGVYELSLQEREPQSGTLLRESQPVTFSLWRSDIVVESLDAQRRFYAPGDLIRFDVRITNRTADTWAGLQVTVGQAQYPWITSPAGSPKPAVFLYPGSLRLSPGESRRIRVEGRIPADAAEGPVHYTAQITCGNARILAFRQSPVVYLRSSGTISPAYPPSYMHPSLAQVRVDNYRSFHPPAGSSPLEFNTTRTAFRSNSLGVVRFREREPLGHSSLVVELRQYDGTLVYRTKAERVEEEEWLAELPFGEAGLYQAVVMPATGSKPVLGTLELAANELPRSLAVICPHPDDEFLHGAAIRATVENGIPVHLIFLTSGDAGGSERFFGPGYTPAEAIEFAGIRMAEAHMAARHFGVPEHRLYFLGLPDGFLETVWHAEGAAICSPLLGANCAVHPGVVARNLRFERTGVLSVLTNLLAAIQPDTVYVSHPAERHGDHRAAAWFTMAALKRLWSTGRLRTVPALRTDVFYGSAGTAAPDFTEHEHRFFASGESMARVQEAYWFYQTQGGNHARGHVVAFADLPRIERHLELTNWVTAASTDREALAWPAAV